VRDLLAIHGLVKRPLVFTRDTLLRYPMTSRICFVECGGNSAPLFSPQPVQADVQALHGLVSCAEWTGVNLSTLLDEAGIDPNLDFEDALSGGLVVDDLHVAVL
jgi:sulfane dehydrogenase subunit SoxC